MNWKSKLTKTERKHLSEHEIRTLNDIRITREKQAEMRASTPGSRELCYECKSIAIKLGIEN